MTSARIRAKNVSIHVTGDLDAVRPHFAKVETLSAFQSFGHLAHTKATPPPERGNSAHFFPWLTIFSSDTFSVSRLGLERGSERGKIRSTASTGAGDFQRAGHTASGFPSRPAAVFFRFHPEPSNPLCHIDPPVTALQRVPVSCGAGCGVGWIARRRTGTVERSRWNARPG